MMCIKWVTGTLLPVTVCGRAAANGSLSLSLPVTRSKPEDSDVTVPDSETRSTTDLTPTQTASLCATGSLSGEPPTPSPSRRVLPCHLLTTTVLSAALPVATCTWQHAAATPSANSSSRRCRTVGRGCVRSITWRTGHATAGRGIPSASSTRCSRLSWRL